MYARHFMARRRAVGVFLLYFVVLWFAIVDTRDGTIRSMKFLHSQLSIELMLLPPSTLSLWRNAISWNYSNFQLPTIITDCFIRSILLIITTRMWVQTRLTSSLLHCIVRSTPSPKLQLDLEPAGGSAAAGSYCRQLLSLVAQIVEFVVIVRRYSLFILWRA